MSKPTQMVKQPKKSQKTVEFSYLNQWTFVWATEPTGRWFMYRVGHPSVSPMVFLNEVRDSFCARLQKEYDADPLRMLNEEWACLLDPPIIHATKMLTFEWRLVGKDKNGDWYKQPAYDPAMLRSNLDAVIDVLSTMFWNHIWDTQRAGQYGKTDKEVQVRADGFCREFKTALA